MNEQKLLYSQLLKRSIFFVFVLLLTGLMPMVMFSQKTVNNPDKPAKGIWDFNPKMVWSVEEVEGEIVSSAEFVNIAKSGKVYYFNEKQTKVIALSPEGKFLFSFGRKGEGPGEFRLAWDMSQIGEYLAVHDARSYHLFDLKGKYRKLIKFPGESEGIVTPDLLLFSREDQSSQSLFLHRTADKSEVLLKKMANPERLMAQGGGLRLRVRDANIVSGIYIDSGQDKIVMGQSGSYQIFVADFSGKITSSFGILSRSRPKIPEAYKTNRFARLKVNGSTLSKSMLQQLAKGIPDHGPHFNRLIIHNSGLIMVMVPEYHKKDQRSFDLFSPSGEYLYRGVIKMPDGMLFNQHSCNISGDTLVMFTEGPDDEGTLKKFKINIPKI